MASERRRSANRGRGTERAMRLLDGERLLFRASRRHQAGDAREGVPRQKRDELATRITRGPGNGHADNATGWSLTRRLMGKLCLEYGVRFLQCPRRPTKEYLYTQCINMPFIAERLYACQEKSAFAA